MLNSVDAGMQPGGSIAAHRPRNNDEDDDFEDEQPLLEPFTQLSLDNVSTSKPLLQHLDATVF